MKCKRKDCRKKAYGSYQLCLFHHHERIFKEEEKKHRMMKKYYGLYENYETVE